MSVKRFVADYKDTIFFIITVGGVVVSIFNFTLLNSIKPLADRIQSVEARTEKIEDANGSLASRSDLEFRFNALDKRMDDLLSGFGQLSERVDRAIIR